VLVQADGQHPGIVPERPLHAVAVVGIHVDVGDPLRALAEQPGDRDHRVVVDAESAGVPGHGVMQAARDARAVLGRGRPDGPGGGQRGPGHRGGRLVHAGEHRVVVGAQPVHEQHPLGHARVVRVQELAAAGQPHDVDVGGVVVELELGAGGRGRDLDRDLIQVEQAEGPGQLHGQLEPDGRHRVGGAEVVAGQPVVPGHVQGTGDDELLGA
jgi:hypothetical protein